MTALSLTQLRNEITTEFRTALPYQSDLSVRLTVMFNDLVDTFAENSVVTPAANESIFTSSGYSVTGAGETPGFDLSGTWNTSGDPIFFKVNLTNTAAGADAKFIDLQISDATKFSVDKLGNIYTNASIYLDGADAVYVDATGSVQWNYDTCLFRVAAGVLKVTDQAGTGAGFIRTMPTTVAALPAAATAGAGTRGMVTDATATTFLSTVAGGGANIVPVVSDGTNWLIG